MRTRKAVCSTCDGSGRRLKPWVITFWKFAPRFGRRLTLFDWAWEPCAGGCCGSGLVDEFDPNPDAEPGALAPWLTEEKRAEIIAHRKADLN